MHNLIAMKSYFITLCASSVLFFSCANEQESATDKSTGNTEAATQTVAPTQLPPTSAPAFSPASQPVTPQQTTPVAAGMNPAHGESGHRCDIAVGAPLNSPPAAAPTVNSAAPTFNTQPVQQAPASGKTSPAATAPGMNPPHGQPGHDCAVAVGAPLNKN
jgi:hypothetical protein